MGADVPHIGLNLVFLVPGETGGMEVYARELVSELASRGDLELTAFVSKAAAGGEWGPGVSEVVVPVDSARRTQWVAGEQWHLPRLARRAGCVLVHSLASTAPLWGPFVRVTTIHDLNYKLVPDAHFGVRGLGMAALVPASARRSHRLIVDAESTAADLTRHLGTPEEKIDVVPLGVGQEPRVAPTEEDRLRGALGLERRRILLSVSAKRPHKNLLRLLEAHARLDERDRPILVVPGYSTPHEAELIAHAERLDTAGDVRFPAWLDQADLDGLYAAATALVFPSLYEGFGLPVLEAMQRGLPVACSDRSSLPEIARGAALLFDPEDVSDIRDTVARILADADLRENLRAAGRERAARFTWERTAAATAAVYRRALSAA
jgi:glycosyltransferase involved in cell wall biosynthesis